MSLLPRGGAWARRHRRHRPQLARRHRAGASGRARIALSSATAIARLKTCASSSAKCDSAAEELDIKLIVGCRLTFHDGSPDLLCYPRDRAAYGRLCRLLTVGKSDRVFKQKEEVPPSSCPSPREEKGRPDCPSPRGENRSLFPLSPWGEGWGEGVFSRKGEIPKANATLPSRISWRFRKARSRR